MILQTFFPIFKIFPLQILKLEFSTKLYVQYFLSKIFLDFEYFLFFFLISFEYFKNLDIFLQLLNILLMKRRCWQKIDISFLNWDIFFSPEVENFLQDWSIFIIEYRDSIAKFTSFHFFKYFLMPRNIFLKKYFPMFTFFHFKFNIQF